MVRISTFVGTLFKISPRFETVQFRHAQIQDGHIRLREFGLLNGFASVTGLSNNFPAELLFEQRSHAHTHKFVVVCH